MGLSLGGRVRKMLCAVAVGAVALTGLAHAQDPFQPPSDPPAAGKASDPQGTEKPESTKPESGGEKTSAKPSTSKAKDSDRVVKTNEEWQKLLTHDEFMVTRMKATEMAFSGKYATGHYKGTFHCVCCGSPLFDSAHKFDSGTGWPSFDRPSTTRAIETAMDYSEPAEARVEVMCRRCGAHLGHVFQDGPTSTGLRYCINSLSLKLDSEKASGAGKTASPARRPARTTGSRSSRSARATTSKSPTNAVEKSNDAEKPSDTEGAGAPGEAPR